MRTILRPRLTTNIGSRFDFVKRIDEIFNVVRVHGTWAHLSTTSDAAVAL